jgi:hypothetical protein
MRIDDYGALLDRCLIAVTITVPVRTLLYSTAVETREMAEAYRMDGYEFMRRGDPVNALASFSYAFGWLDAGCCLGFFAAVERCWPFDIGEVTPLPEHQRQMLREKTIRYRHLLFTAINAVEVAPERGSPLFQAAEKVHFISRIYALLGETRISAGVCSSALACYSYGHGWLDTGVRAGLFRIHGARELFAL